MDGGRWEKWQSLVVWGGIHCSFLNEETGSCGDGDHFVVKTSL